MIHTFNIYYMETQGLNDLTPNVGPELYYTQIGTEFERFW